MLDGLESGLDTASAVDALLADLAGRAERVEAAIERLLIDHVSYHDLPRPARELRAHGADPAHVYTAVFDQKRAYVRTAAPP